MSTIQSIGIIGLGAFGQFVASLLPPAVEVVGYDPSKVKTTVKQAALAEVTKSDVLVMAVPLNAYQELLQRIKPHIRPGTLVIDVCSVKSEPERLLRQYLHGHPNVLATHPLFGPESTADGTAGHTLIVTKSTGDKALDVLDFCRQTLGLDVRQMTPKAHDRAMAQVHALTFFVARGLANTKIGGVPFETPSFQMILDLVSLDRNHSEDLFQTIQRGNPYAEKARSQLMQSFENLAATLTPKENP